MHKIKFCKNDFRNALEIAYFCISEKYNSEMTYNEFRTQLKEDRANGLLKVCKFKLNLRSNYLLDLCEYE